MYLVMSSISSSYFLCIVLYFIVSLIYGRRHGFRTTLKPCVQFVLIFFLSLFSWLMKLHQSFCQCNKLVSKLGLKISWRGKDHRAHKMKTKGIFSENGVDCSLVVIWYKKFVSWKVWRLTSWNLVKNEDC